MKGFNLGGEKLEKLSFVLLISRTLTINIKN
jgi:hypothetical protein